MIIEIGLPDINEDLIENLCEIADNAINKFIFSKFSKSKVTILETTIEINSENKICQLDIELNLEIPTIDTKQTKEIADKAIEMAFEAIEKELKK